jgi:hypothetical protein
MALAHRPPPKVAYGQRAHAPVPPYWEKCVLAAYLRMMGATQADAARAVGRSLRTISGWESLKDQWALALEEARKRWLIDLEHASRAALLGTIKEGNGMLALQVLERLDADLAPAKQRLDVELSDGLASLLAQARKASNGDTPR